MQIHGGYGYAEGTVTATSSMAARLSIFEGATRRCA